MKKLVLLLFLSIACGTLQNQDNNQAKNQKIEAPATKQAVAPSSSKTYTFLTYNVENLFDADGIAPYEDYNTYDKEGNPQYGNKQIFNKFSNVARILKKYNEGKGPDVIAFVELESDQTPSHRNANPDSFLVRYANTSLEKMLGDEFNDEIADLPSEFLLLKSMADAGLPKYYIYLGYSELKNGKPNSVQKNAVFSKFPINKEKSRLLQIERARPIVEAWLDVEGNDFVVFVNHWKSGASTPSLEKARIQNAEVLRNRLDELARTNPKLDYVLAGDFNALYNQHLTLKGVDKTALRDVLLVSGDEDAVASGEKKIGLYNLWYEFPWDERGTEAYRGNRSTLMNIIIPGTMYDAFGVQYVDNSLEIGRFIGMNSSPFSPIPIRWSNFGEGSGFSDHFPLSMKFRLAKEKVNLENPGFENDETDSLFLPLPFKIPEMSEVHQLTEIDVNDLRTEKYYNQYFYCELVLDENNDAEIGGKKYKVYGESKEIGKRINQTKDANQGLVKFFGRLTLYRTTWEFIIETPKYIMNAEN